MRKNRIILFGLVLLSSLSVMANELVLGPYLQNAQSTEVTIMWETKSATVGKVRFGTNAWLFNHSSEEQEARNLHQVKLENLLPSQIYYYQCSWKGGKPIQGQFSTAPEDNLTPLRIAVIGDSRSNLVMSRKLSNMIVDKHPDVVLHTGDLVPSGKNLPEWKTFLFDPMQKLLRNIPFYPIPGNHEGESPHYYSFFAPLHNDNPWWSRDYGSVHIIGLDTNVPTDQQSEQYQFLVDDLQNNNKPWTIVMFHHPLFHSHPTREVYEFRYDWQPLFIEHGVDIVLTGHDHYYQRTFPIGRMAENQRGVVHYTIAGGGATLYPTIPRSYSAFDRSLYHFVLIDVTENELEIRAVDENNQVFDAIIINKNQDYSAANFVEYGVFELERDLKQKLGGIAPREGKDDDVFFDTTLAIESNFYLPVSIDYSWQATDAWKLEESSNKSIVKPGGEIQIKLVGQVEKDHFMPTPELTLHLEADNSSRNIVKHRPYSNYVGFRNQDLLFSIEDAAFNNAIYSSSGDTDPLFAFIDYFAGSKYAYDVIMELGSQLLRTGDQNILANLHTFSKNNPTDLNKFRIYPFFFLQGDYSSVAEWIAILRRLPSEQVYFEPKLICRLIESDVFNSETIAKWKLIGPFSVVEGMGLSTIFPPEIEIDFTKYYPANAGKDISWSDYQSNGNSIDLMEALKAPEYTTKDGVAYAHTTVTANKDGEIILLFGSDDDPVIWINGSEIHRKQIGRGLHPCQDIIIVPVRTGENNILIKVVQRTGGWALDLRISDWQRILE